MNNDQLKAEADELMQRCVLAELLKDYPRWFVGGSYSYDLMCWRDRDVYVLDPQFDLKRCFDVARELTQRLDAKESRFTNNVSSPPKADEPKGLYWGLKLGDERKDAWKIDLWFLDLPEYEQHQNYSARMRARLTAETRAAILEIKQAFWQGPEYRDTITSGMIYRAVLDDGVKGIEDFERWRPNRPMRY